ncbi:hypothetical protein QE152_g13671 [Popillia japonica]|uniref:MULE transposase domain-containing protein n=1 Tax=Popillia japonica TaxID=7064 RepID=A0AAW1LCN0_POPJA
MALVFVKSQKGNNNKGARRVHTVGNEITKSTEHNHFAETAKCEAKEASNRMKEVAQQLELSTQGVVAEVPRGLSLAVTAQLPSVSSLNKNCSKSSERATGCARKSKKFPEDYKRTTDGELFLLFDSGPEEQRILLFSTQRNLSFMEQCGHWFADGTFKSAPPLFSQIYTIHGVRYSNVIPTVFALLPNKTQETYTRVFVFQQLKVLNPGLRPLTIMDFERAAMNAA